MDPMSTTRARCFEIPSIALALHFARKAKRTHEYGGFPEGTRGYLRCATCGKALNSFEFYEDACPGRPSDASGDA